MRPRADAVQTFVAERRLTKISDAELARIDQARNPNVSLVTCLKVRVAVADLMFTTARECHASLHTLSGKVGRSEPSVRYALRALEEAGVLEPPEQGDHKCPTRRFTTGTKRLLYVPSTPPEPKNLRGTCGDPQAVQLEPIEVTANPAVTSTRERARSSPRAAHQLEPWLVKEIEGWEALAIPDTVTADEAHRLVQAQPWLRGGSVRALLAVVHAADPLSRREWGRAYRYVEEALALGFPAVTVLAALLRHVRSGCRWGPHSFGMAVVRASYFSEQVAA